METWPISDRTLPCPFEKIRVKDKHTQAWIKKKGGGSQHKDNRQISKIFLYSEDDNKW